LKYRTNFTSRSGYGYNLKLIEYPNNSAQIRLYDRPLELSPGQPDIEDENLVQEPFGGKFVREVKDLTSRGDPMENRRISLARTRRIIAEHAKSASWQWFATLTWDPKDKRADRTNYKKCCQQIRTWLKNVRDRKDSELQYLAVPELHKDMVSWHFHMLLNTKLEMINSGIIKKGRVIYNIPGWTFGYSTATKITDTYSVQKYITKYMTKECFIMSRGEHRYFVSHNLPKPKKSIFLAEPGEEAELIQEIIEQLGMEISSVFHSDGNYTGVTYIDLEPYTTENSKKL